YIISYNIEFIDLITGNKVVTYEENEIVKFRKPNNSILRKELIPLFFICDSRRNICNMISSSHRTCSLPMYAIIGLTAIIYATTVGAELRQVNVIFRHGDRTPDTGTNEMYPNDPYLNSAFYPLGRGQLSNEGKRREYQLGKVLRERYPRFLGDIYTPESVWGMSSDYDRTKMSLQLVLAGLFPPNKEQKWNPQLNWQPIPTRYLQRPEDNIFLADECPQ
ncbi:venom acid phosphatase Acph-1-like, partial [Hylaeus anthracinus]|uniref:venom acid phosphatase Acph-1-like n=1 Tax=Hylaeus anthracinus TaxID=313031 RepID=UPI0023B8F099